MIAATAYECDITYATNNELGFDYLRDNMKYSRDQMVQRPFNFAIVDEVDSILIDEARTPLIISGPTDDKSELYMSVDAIVKTFVAEDYEKDEKQKSRRPDRGRHRKGRADARGSGPDRGPQPLRHRQHPGRPPPEPVAEGERDVQAGHRLHREGRQGRHHRRVHRPDDGRAALVRRAAPGGRGQGRRRDRAREPDARVDHLPELFPHVPEAVGHDRHRADRSARILRHLPDERRVDPDQRRRSCASDEDDEFYKNITDKFAAIAKEIRERQEKGQPVLVGTVSIEKSEMLSEFLATGGHQARGAERPLPRERSAYRRAGRAGSAR